jgi:hypothetical protein
VVHHDEKNSFFRRSFAEQRTALDLVGLANQQADLDFNGDQVSSLLTTLIVSSTIFDYMSTRMIDCSIGRGTSRCG